MDSRIFRGEDGKETGYAPLSYREADLQNYRVPAKNRIWEENGGFKILLSGLDGGQINAGAGAVENAKAVFDIDLNIPKKEFKSDLQFAGRSFNRAAW